MKYAVCLIFMSKTNCKVLKGSQHVAFAENASFKTFGIICWSPLPFSFTGEHSMDKRDSNGFFPTQKVCMASHRPNNMTGSSLIVAYWQRSFLAIYNQIFWWFFTIWRKNTTQRNTRRGSESILHVVLHYVSTRVNTSYCEPAFILLSALSLRLCTRALVLVIVDIFEMGTQTYQQTWYSQAFFAWQWPSARPPLQ